MPFVLDAGAGASIATYTPDFPLELKVGYDAAAAISLNVSGYLVGWSWVQTENKTLNGIYIGLRGVGTEYASNVKIEIFTANASGYPSTSLASGLTNSNASYQGCRYPVSGINLGLSLTAGTRYAVVITNPSSTPATNNYQVWLEPLFPGRFDDGCLFQSSDNGATWTGNRHGIFGVVLSYSDGTRWGPSVLSPQGYAATNGTQLYSSASYNGIVGLAFIPDNGFAITSAEFALTKATNSDCGTLVCKVYRGVTPIATSVNTVTPTVSGNYGVWQPWMPVYTWYFNPPVQISPGEFIVVALSQQTSAGGSSSNYFYAKGIDAACNTFPLPTLGGAGCIPWNIQGVKSTSLALTGWVMATATPEIPSCRIRLLPVGTRGQF